MLEQVEMIELHEGNVDGGCYCLRSKPKSTGYVNKTNWLKSRLNEGLKYITITENRKPAGFIEYAPIESSTRVVYGENFHVIHCVWVQITGKGYASKLIEKCIQDAREQKKNGVIVITNPETSWTPSKEIFLKHGFIQVDQAPYGFELLVYKLNNSQDPFFPTDWDDRLTNFNNLTILRTQQCPFVVIATENVMEAAAKLGIEAEVIDIQNRDQLMNLSPTPYGIYGVIYRNTLIAYHRLTVHSAHKKLKQLVETS